MTPAETAKVLAKAGAYDLRTVGQVDVVAWHEVLGDVDFDDAMQAVTRHYTDNTERLMPAHVRRIAFAIDRDRRRVARELVEARQQRELEADPTRRNRSDEVKALIARLRTELPEGDPDKLHRPEWVELERARERERRAVPNPLYNPTAVVRLAEMAGEPA